MRRLYSLFSRSSNSTTTSGASKAAPAHQSVIEETICAPKALPKRCLNEGGHKAVR